MSTPNAYRDKVKQLESELQQAMSTVNTHNSESCLSMTMIIGCAVPIIVFLGFYVASPSIVTEENEETGKPERSLKKVLLWTTLITLIMWSCIYGYNAYKGGSVGLLCTRNQ
jgi:amino acid transporter